MKTRLIGLFSALALFAATLAAPAMQPCAPGPLAPQVRAQADSCCCGGPGDCRCGSHCGCVKAPSAPVDHTTVAALVTTDVLSPLVAVPAIRTGAAPLLQAVTGLQSQEAGGHSADPATCFGTRAPPRS